MSKATPWNVLGAIVAIVVGLSLAPWVALEVYSAGYGYGWALTWGVLAEVLFGLAWAGIKAIDS
jgi:hypothetical protein